MKYLIDTEEGSIRCIKAPGEESRVDFYSPAGFRLLSQLWVKQEWNLFHWQSFTWFGFQIWQLPEDLLRIQEVIIDLKPDLILETGVKRGGSAIFFASLCRLLGRGRVISIDITIPSEVHHAITSSPFADLITLIEGDSVASKVVARVKGMVKPEERVLVFLDSDHSRSHVLAELRAYADLVPLGSYLVATDGVMRDLAFTPHGRQEWVTDNPAAAARDFVVERNDFVIERPKAHFRDDSVAPELTFWPDAWIKRIAHRPADKMSTCILHFGMHKTGSSAIQQALCSHLKDPAFRYLSMAGCNQSADLITLFAPHPLDHPIHRRLGTDAPGLGELKERVHQTWVSHCCQAAGKTGILSGESMMTLPEAGLRALKAFLLEYASALRVVGYVRAPKSYIESAFQERLKDGQTELDEDMLFPRYQQLFTKFIQTFGASAIDFWKFDPDSFPQGDVVRDFCTHLGIDFSSFSSAHINVGMSLTAVKLLYAYRTLGPGYGTGHAAIGQNQRLVTHLLALDGPRFHLHSSLIAPLLERYQEEIRWMEERLHQSLAEDLYRHDPIGIRDSKELLVFAPQETLWLAQQLGDRYLDRWHAGMDAAEVAKWMQEWRIRLRNETAPCQ